MGPNGAVIHSPSSQLRLCQRSASPVRSRRIRVTTRDTLAALALQSAVLEGVHSDAASDQTMAPVRLIDVPNLDGWVTQWDQLVDSAPLPSPFLRSWWLAGTSRFGRHFLLVVDDTRLLGGLALEERHPTARIRMMGYGSASDHLDLLAAPGHEATVIKLLGDWLRRPGGRLFDLKGIQSGSRLIEALPGRVRREPMAVAPFTPLPSSADAYRSSLSPQFRRNHSSLRWPPRRRRRDPTDHSRSRDPCVPRHPPRTAPRAMG